jgi:excisionase family DNA binding protein
MDDSGRERLLTLIRDPRLASDVPSDQAATLLAEVAALQWSLGVVQAQLLVRALAPNGGTTRAGAADENLSAEEAARRLGLSKDWLYRHADSLPSVRIGRRVLFSASGLERWNRQRMGR